jgi:radical SAM protein with 4Fe4S-binding SPASM domain
MIEYHKRPFKLTEFKIEVTYRCTLNCVHCSSDARPSNPLEMARDDCLRFVSDAAQAGAKKVAFSGGEPLLWPHIFDAVKSARQSGLEVSIYTSGNVSEFAAKVRRLRELDTVALIFSLFGDNEITHKRVTRVAGSFKKTCDAIALAGNSGLATEIHFVPMSNNYRELGNVVKLGDSLRVMQVSVLRLVPQGRAALIRGRVLHRVQNLELRRQIADLRRSGFSIRTGSPYNFLMLSNQPKCCAAIDRLIIGPDLRVYPCDAFKQVKAEEIAGTLEWSSLTNCSVSDCWAKSHYLEAVRTYLTTPFHDPCDSCALLEKCLSGCLAQKVIAYGTLDKRPDPDCLGPNFRGDEE